MRYHTHLGDCGDFTHMAVLQPGDLVEHDLPRRTGIRSNCIAHAGGIRSKAMNLPSFRTSPDIHDLAISRGLLPNSDVFCADFANCRKYQRFSLP